MFERLTERCIDEPVYIPDESKWQVEDELGAKCLVGEAVDHLAAYEDSGLTPEEVQGLAQAKADGRLVVLPGKSGDVVWKIKAVFSYFSKPMEDRVDRIIISNNEILVCCTGGAKFSIDSIGKTVFLTREEAEKALEGSK